MSIKLKSNSLKSGESDGNTCASSLSGPKQVVPHNYGGLGSRYFQQLSIEADKVLQVDTINNLTETKGSMKTRSIRLAIEMSDRGVGPNDVILISSKTHAHQTIVVLSTLFLGAIVCPISPESPYKECYELVRKLKPKMCFCDSRTVSQIERILLNAKMMAEVVNFGDEVPGTTQFSKLLPFKEDSDFKPVFIENPHLEVAFIMPTQGTSSDNPKLVCLSHHNIFVQCITFMEVFDNPSKVISFFPLSWITQTILACTSLEYGVTRIMAGSFNERTACKLIHDFIIDVAVLGTELAMRLTGNVAVKDFNLSCLKSILVGVMRTTPDDLRFMRQALPKVKFLQTYVLTETGIVSATLANEYSDALTRSTTVGHLVINSKIKILDVENKQPVGPNVVGEVYFNGDGLMLGYFKDNAGTKEVIEKSYFKTGDLAKYDEEGWLYLEGRIEDMIYHKNSNFFFKQLEDCVIAHPGVHDAVVIGNANQLILFVEKKPDAVLHDGHISMYLSRKMPSLTETLTKIEILDEFPRTNAGNIKKRVLRDEFLKVKIRYTRSLASISAGNEGSSTEGSIGK